MKTTKVTLTLKPYIQPFEKELALIEAGRFFGVAPGQEKGKEKANTYAVKVNSREPLDEFLKKSAYWLYASSPNPEPTRQSIWESTTEVAKANGSISVNLPENTSEFVQFRCNRRNLRYGVHGIHEYRGKYFPQLARSLINISVGSGCKGRARILDPMIGSGTTAVEANSLGYDCYGLDMNPLSAYMAKVKTDLLHLSYSQFCDAYKNFSATLHEGRRKKRQDLSFLDDYSQADAAYLKSWFPASVLGEVGAIRRKIDSVPVATFRSFLEINLSNILRSVSYQKDDDLRVRRVAKSVEPGEVYDRFLDVLQKNASAVSAFLYYTDGADFGRATIEEGDARTFRSWGIDKESIDCVVTSPPYATALPYLDTDRLSLIMLRQVEKRELREKDNLMIGNREVTKSVREDIWRSYLQGQKELPDSVVRIINEIKHENEKNGVGFRRQNMPYLLAKYFLDMRDVFESMSIAMRDRADAFVVVGDNQTTSGAKTFTIKSAEYLKEIATMVGFEFVQTIPMDMLVSRDLHRKNSVKTESIVWLKKVNSSPNAG